MEPRSLTRGAPQRVAAPGLIHIVIGFATNFFDILGIGSFATTTSTYRLLALVPDDRIPGTMLVGHTLPVVVQAREIAAARYRPVRCHCRRALHRSDAHSIRGRR
jgi:hypothetical protein